MKKIWLFLITIIALSGILIQTQAQPNTLPVPFHFSISNSGINRFVADQWGSVTHNWTGTYQGMNYNLNLKRPVVDLSLNMFKITLEVEIYASVSGTPIFDETVSFSPELTIPVTVVNPDSVIKNIRAVYTDLETAIDGISIISDQRIRDILEDKLDDIEWIIYQGELLTQTSLRWSDSFDVGFYGLPELSFAVGEGALVLTISPMIYGNEPEYQFQWRRPSTFNYQIRILSNNEIDLKSIQTTTTAGQSASAHISVSSSFDATLNKHVAVYSFNGGSAAGQLICKLRLMRAGLETVWTVQGFVATTTSNWINFTSITPVWGE